MKNLQYQCEINSFLEISNNIEGSAAGERRDLILKVKFRPRGTTTTKNEELISIRLLRLFSMDIAVNNCRKIQPTWCVSCHVAMGMITTCQELISPPTEGL